MNNFTEEEYKLMDKYRNNTIEHTKKEAFQKRLKAEPALAAELEWLKKLEVNYSYLRWKEHFQELHRQLDATGDLEIKTIKPTFWVQWGQKLAMAASVVLVLGSGFYFFALKSKETEVSHQTTKQIVLPENDNVAKNNKEKLNTDFLAMVDSYALQSPKDLENVPTELKTAIAAYQEDQTTKAIKLLQKPIDQSVLRPPSNEPNYGASKGTEVQKGNRELDNKKEVYRHLYLGLSYLKTNQIEKALTEITQAKFGDTKTSAEWYEGLCYLKLNQISKAETILNNISKNNQHPYQADAEEILNTIN